jgi:FkbM family methyltransferase
MTVQRDYESGGVGVHWGDSVIDCGAHVGMFTRYALHRGAERLVAIEPDPTNLACLERNLAEEIAAGNVLVVRAGVWDRRDELTLFHSLDEENTGGHSFAKARPASVKVFRVPVMPRDEILGQRIVDRVDFIKMDIEGAERQALTGAAHTLRRWQPRLAICAYHLDDDPTLLPAIVKAAQPAYRYHAKDVEIINQRVTTKVLFFQ